MKDRLKELRKKLGLKQREVAERLGVPVSSVGAWEIGKYPIPKTRIYQICNEYHVRREWLVDGQGEMFEPDPAPIDVDEAQRRFVMQCFDELLPETQQIIIDSMKRYLDEARPQTKTPEETPATNAPNEILVAGLDLSGDWSNA